MQAAPFHSERALRITAPLEPRTTGEGSLRRDSRLPAFEQQHLADSGAEPSPLLPIVVHGLDSRIESTADPWPSLASARKPPTTLHHAG